MKSSPNVSVMVVKVSRPPTYKVIRIEKKDLVIAFKNCRFSDALRFKGIHDELVHKVTPAWKTNGVICINATLDVLAANVTHRFDEKNHNVIIAVEKKIDTENHKSASAEELAEQKGESIESQKSSDQIQDETIKETHVPVEETFLSRLVAMHDNDEKPDAKLFVDATGACKKDQWEEGIKNITEFIEKYPESKFIERAFFLLAECYRRLYTDNLSEHIQEIAKNYEAANRKFSGSVYVPAATLILANTYFKLQNYYESLAYYNILCSRHKDDECAPEARFQLGKVYLMINKPEKAISAFQAVAEQYPRTFFAIKSKMEAAKVFFEMNRFKKSLSIWSGISQSDPDSVYEMPDILIYIGNNYYQLGQYRNARDALLRAINIHPDIASKHPILPRIADTYYELGAKESAYKFYNLAIKEYPESDGALISSIRLASRYKKKEDEKISLLPPIGSDSSDYHFYSNPQELYENIITRHSDNPISQFIMLKIAILQQQDEEYEASINTIKRILKKYSLTGLEKDVLQDSYKALFKQEIKKQNYITILNHYERDKDFLDASDRPEIFLAIGEAYRELCLHNSAFSMFQKANKFFLEEDRPPELLFGLGESLFRNSDLKTAQRLFADLVQKYPGYKDVPFAYYRIGQILLREKKYNEAKKNLEIALANYHNELSRADIVASIAETLKGMKKYNQAITRFKEAITLLTKQNSFEDLYDAYISLGGLYITTGDNLKAARTLESALEMKEKDDATGQHGVMFRLAGCYRRLEKTGNALDLLKKIATSQDTLWGRMAMEEIKEIDIRQKIAIIGKSKS
ncbi:MAG: tetratricopeptide repeat protein [Pseudomonadota bacterium]